MPYSYPNKVPKVAKNWDASRQRKCARAANAVLNAGGSEQDAIFACIHASKVKQVEEDEYDDLTESGAEDFQKLLELYFAGRLVLSALRSAFRSRLREFYAELAVLGMQTSGRTYTSHDIDFLNKQLDQAFLYLEGFLADLENNRISEQRALWRAGKYAYPRAVYINFTVAASVAALMPFLPGDDCLGNGLCKCHLQVEEDNGGAAVYWILDPAAESCEVCIAHATESPFRFSAEELADAFSMD